VAENGKPTTPVTNAGAQRSQRLRTVTCVAGIGAAGVGLVYVLTGSARAVDVVLIVGGLLVTLAGLVLMRERS
jgi:uncharacterized membrane protein HdeD (DUF308 family)